MAAGKVVERDEAGRPLRMFGVHMDITERKRAEAALRQSERKCRLLTESIKDVVWVMDAESLRFLYVSPSVAGLRGYAPEEIIEAPFGHALGPESVEYAFRDGSEGLIRLEASSRGGRLRVTVQDDGEGMQAKQLNASLGIERGEGTRIILEFAI